MKKLNNVEVILSRLIELLRAGAANEWAVAIEKIKEEFEQDPSYSSQRILSIYGGMGSFNDVVLYREGQPLILENNELDDLRNRLYSICKGWSGRV